MNGLFSKNWEGSTREFIGTICARSGGRFSVLPMSGESAQAQELGLLAWMEATNAMLRALIETEVRVGIGLQSVWDMSIYSCLSLVLPLSNRSIFDKRAYVLMALI